MSTTRPTSLNPMVPRNEETVDLLELAAIFFAEWRSGVLTLAIIFLIGALFTFITKPLFEASALILPQQSQSESNSLAAIFSSRSPADVYLGLLSSRTVADKVIDRVHLMNVFHTSSYAKARVMLASNSKFTARKDMLVGIQIRNADAATASAMVNAYLDALQDLQEGMAIEQASMRRRIFEKQVQQERTALSAAEDDLQKEQQKSGLVQPESQTQIGLTAIAAARSQIANLQVQLAALLQSETDQSPRVVTLRSQIAQLEAHQRDLESGSRGGVGASLPSGKMPEANLEFARRLRDVRYHEALLTALANQYENARLSEVQTVSQFQVVDRAVVPERKSWPPRVLFLALSLVLGMMVGAIVMVVRIAWHRLKADPVQSQHLEAIRNSFRLAR